jgi:Zn-dependent peptidase ImmA (M78 family)/DNA-binding XRE family transcriptional regulator
METNILDNLNPIDLGSDLKQAREKRSLTQQDAADIINVARTTITAIEKGTRRIKAGELIKLVKAYGRDIGEFVRESRPKSESFQLQFRVAYKNRNDMPEDDSVEELETLAKNYIELETILDRPLKYNYPEPYETGGYNTDREAENVAFEERKRLGLGDGPIPILRDILEQEVGLRIFYLAIHPTTFSAMYVYDHQSGGCIAVNRLHPEERRRWSLAHEFAHFLAHRFRADLFDDSYWRLPERERFADDFAKHFLMPTSSLMRQVRDVGGKPSAADLCTWAHYFGVSVQALTLRLEEMKVLPVGMWDKLKDAGFRVREAQQSLGLGPLPEHAEKLPLRYQYLAVEAYDNELISEGQLTRFLGVSRIEARELAERLSYYADVRNGHHLLNLADYLEPSEDS